MITILPSSAFPKVLISLWPLIVIKTPASSINVYILSVNLPHIFLPAFIELLTYSVGSTDDVGYVIQDHWQCLMVDHHQ